MSKMGDYDPWAIFCQKCESPLIYLSSGGCGGLGSHYGCEKCDIVWEQATGGYLPTPGGEQYQNSGWGSIKEFKERLQQIDTQKEEWRRLKKLSDENKKHAMKLFKQCLAEIHSLGFEVWAFNKYTYLDAMTGKSVVFRERKDG